MVHPNRRPGSTPALDSLACHRRRTVEGGLEPVVVALMDEWVVEAVERAWSSGTLDLSEVNHTTATHEDLARLSSVAWWLLAVGSQRRVTVTLPAGRPSQRHLLRAGVIGAARRHNLPMTVAGEPWSVHDDFRDKPQRLPNEDWESYDEGSLPEDRIRVVPDLDDRRRRPDPGLVSGGRYYRWIDSLSAATALPEEGRRRFHSDADQVLFQLIDNVHRWAGRCQAQALCSVTKGGGTRDDGSAASFNRLHIVVMDVGRGIPRALQTDPVAFESVRQSGGDDPFGTDLVHTLLERAFGEREIEGHDGYGLHGSQKVAGDWVGRLDVMTVELCGKVVHVRTRGVSRVEDLPTSVVPGARGTLVHVMLQAVTEADRPPAAAAEDIPQQQLQTN